ncbi:sulfite exporter TauE/SafE family protein [Pelagibacterium flavum]|uniref:Probable membrane transporter protein n=1 Tax=Pelagibacterium flavum TaxID=2984530 RepID=A0ABY6IP07_9HYPH|nr:sulfite exporter TauE/SafE family protein [Pelagibacterium sp. YIM 151497]UYQ72348.1 sulfite exporter TauE/SafE family protein [Pelagibacterium sp. YIM 151497]|tara:strand:- start:2753 stop:3493 length:741 start_codon:yes stop_codon:yes gene_type:complete
MDIIALAIIFVAVGAGAISKGATGMGMPLIAIPFLAATFGLQHAIAVLLIPILVSNASQLYRFRHARGEAGLGFLQPMLMLCVVGVIAGTWFLTSTPERGLALTLGILLLGYLALRLLNPHFTVGPQAARRWAMPAGLGAGLLHGATGISAPIGVTFIHAMRFGRDAHVYAVSAMFMVLAIFQAPSLWVAGILRPEWLMQGMFALIPTFLFMPVGQWLAGKMSQSAFDRMILIFLGAIGLKMVLGF